MMMRSTLYCTNTGRHVTPLRHISREATNTNFIVFCSSLWMQQLNWFLFIINASSPFLIGKVLCIVAGDQHLLIFYSRIKFLPWVTHEFINCMLNRISWHVHMATNGETKFLWWNFNEDSLTTVCSILWVSDYCLMPTQQFFIYIRLIFNEMMTHNP